MDLDIRQPIGLLFLSFGAILVIYGVAADPAMYQTHSLGLNINLWWGAFMALFGLLMLGLSLRRRRGLQIDGGVDEAESAGD